jgi:hypothetical protein
VPDAAAAMARQDVRLAGPRAQRRLVLPDGVLLPD